MASSPVRIREQDKARLEKLRQELVAASGQRPSQQEAISKVIEFASRHKEDFIGEAVWQPLDTAAIKRWLQTKSHDWGDVSHEDIDRVVYGDE